MLFDLDDTLLDAYGNPRETWLRLLAGFAPRLDTHGKSIEQVADAIIAHGRPLWSDPVIAARWRLDIPRARREVTAGAFAALGLATTADRALAEEIADAFTQLRIAEYKLFPQALAVLGALRAEGIRLALITNGCAAIQRHKVERFKLERHFDHIQIEGEFGKGKPEPEVYAHALSRIGVAANESWMIGDNLEWDVLAPQRHGIHGIWYDPRHLGLEGHMHTGVPSPMPDAKPARIIHELTELLAA
jgi:putative hydrolase of the HAD superfamily